VIGANHKNLFIPEITSLSLATILDK